MLQVPIEKEIDTPKSFYKKYSLRQFVSIALIVVICIYSYCKLKNINLAVLCSAPFALIIGGMGFLTIGGLNFEELASRLISLFVYKNKTRKYRTLNQYVSLFNSYFTSLRKNDLKDKRKSKIIKQNKKRQDNQAKRSKIKPIK